ncbi:MAG: glycosyltransferase, partial [Bacteroidota bacterium]|nr:glycosyltransferase [Bacteroidota bacterium]
MVALSPLFFYAFVAIGIVNISYFAYFSIFPFRPQRSIHTNSEEESISVIVCAQNEINNLRTLIPKLLEQDFSVFEILIVNDHSTDGSLELLREFDQ